MEICTRTEQRFELNVFPEKVELLTQAGTHARLPRNKTELADACLTTGFAALAANDYASAAALAQLATDTAAGSGDPSQAQQADFLNSETALCSDAFEIVSNSWNILRDKPNDPPANLAVGKFLYFVKNDLAAGLPLLARGNDEALKMVVNWEINGNFNDASQKLALGNSWWDLSAKAQGDDQLFYQRRARFWYLKCLASSKGPDKNRLHQQLADRLATVPAEAGVVHIVSRVGGAEFVDIYSDEVRWKSSRRGTSGNKINQVSLGDFAADGLEVIKNTGASWLMPDTVDFSTAHLTIDRRSSRRGQATLQISDDHVRVILAHPRLGESEMDVTVTFQKKP
jgi:hypothetical protein